MTRNSWPTRAISPRPRRVATRVFEPKGPAHACSICLPWFATRPAIATEAERYYRKALYLDPHHGEAATHLALLIERQGRAEEAAVLRRRVERIASHGGGPAVIISCWNDIGVRGDRSCPELAEYVHCRNCPVHAAAASSVLQRAVPDGYLAEWTAHVARPVETVEPQTESAVIFRVLSEWLALPAGVVTEVAEPRPVHSLPHSAGRALRGVTSVRGELVVAVSLVDLIGLAGVSPGSAEAAGGYPRSMVIESGGVRAVCPVDELEGIHRFRQDDLLDVPATLGRAPVRFTIGFLPWRNRSVGLLDADRLIDGIKRSLA